MFPAYPSVDTVNRKYYNGKMLSYSKLLGYVQEFNEGKKDLGLKKADLMNDIPCMWDHKDLIEVTHGDKFKDAMAESPYRVVYIWFWAPEVAPAYSIGGVQFHHIPAYIGEGTIHRALSHCMPLKGEPITEIQQVLTDYIKVGGDPLMMMVCKNVNVDMAKYVEADFIRYFDAASHFTRGVDAFTLGRPPLNVRREKSHEGRILKVDGTFGRSN